MKKKLVLLIFFITIKGFSQDFELRSTPTIESKIIYKDGTTEKGLLWLASSVFSPKLKQEEDRKDKKIDYKIKDIEVLRDAFFKAGKVPLKVNEATWAKFKDAVRTFNRGKNSFYKDLKKDQYDNLKKKKDLIQIAEENKDSEDFAKVTPLMKKIQNECLCRHLTKKSPLQQLH